ncbi:exonuclease domain-containing protein [Oxalobacteraceae bacterium R-40]|uniref:Excinuclease cho n=1 Tax=Keguizhuia sedimenti TaxID=3064264 RepID=A0ABU1BSN8_9BURK|nr:exonuclease domain-containing protein [Oxalobacteraceae bacterium R-40]
MHSFSSSRPPRLAFVDLETTGGTANVDRITEVGIIEVDEDGVREWSSLVNPQMSIPPFIQSLTGISDAMVRDAPTFEELAASIQARLADRIFIAHNARFDHGFLKNEFKRTGHDFHPSVLCTVRLSRKLYPEFARHNLDSLIERHNLRVSERHRALGDAQLLWQFWQIIHASHAPEIIEETVSKLISRPSLPSRLDARQIEALPSSHGVYLYYGANDLPLYIGKANNLRKRVMQHFSGDHLSAKELKISQQVERVDWIETAGEIGALLQEASLIKQRKPAHNRRLRQNDDTCAWRLRNKDGVLSLSLATTRDSSFGRTADLYGLFTSKRQANDALKAIVDTHQLCQAVLGLEKVAANKPCFGRQVGKCLGACCGREAPEAHNRRLIDALQSLQLQAWPYQGAVALEENGALHVVDNWAYLGTAASMADARGLLEEEKPRFDRDVYQILLKCMPDLEHQITPL